MTCKQLGGPCDEEFHAETFEEMSEMSKKHGMEMGEKGDATHIKAMEEMKESMNDPQAMQNWMKETMAVFEALPEDE